MAMLFELKKQREEALAKSDAILKAAEANNRPFTEAETVIMAETVKEVEALNPQIASIEKHNTLRAIAPRGQIIPAGPAATGHTPSVFSAGYASYGARVMGKATGHAAAEFSATKFTAEYANAFFAFIASLGRPSAEISAALYEGSSSAGGYAVPIVVDDQIVPLAPQEMAVRRIAQVIPTTTDIKFPSKLAFGTAAINAELGTFGGTAPTLEQFTLSAFMAGVLNALSWELAQDVPAFQSFLVQDMILAQQMFEENLYVNGSGSGQAQGLIGNVGAGVTLDPDANGNVVGINGTLDLIGTLNAAYHANASWLMNRTTSIIIRKAQVEANLFFPAWTSSGKQDFLHGYPVEYSAYVPTAARGAAPLLFGDFKQGYLIGDRGGAGINVKVLDQPLASQGQLQLLTYRRTDGRVRRSEAIQQYNVTASGTSAPE